jgi:hypothetical protein
MPEATAVHEKDGEVLTVNVEIEETFPDAIDEARTQAVRGVLEMHRAIYTVEPADDSAPKDSG